MKRAVLCVSNPQDYIDQLIDYSIMIVNPNSTKTRKQYLLEKSDWSVLITQDDTQYRSGSDYPNEKLLWYTSGTVGDSKFYSFSQQQLDSLTQSIIHDLEITNNDRYMGVMSLWHAHGQSLYWATKKAGCETKFVVTQQLRQMTDFQPTFVSAIPDLLKVVQDLPLVNLRFVRSGSAPLSRDLYDALAKKFKVPVIEYFGMTEAMSHVLSNPLHGPQRPGTVGIPTAGVKACVNDGRLWIQSGMAYTNDWFDTGDLAEQDESGYFKIIGRSVDQINVKGYKLNPTSIEKQLQSMVPDLGECVIFGQDRVHCLFTGSADKNKIFQCLLDIHKSCRPALLEKVDQIPIGNSGKLSRKWLAQHYNFNSQHESY